jgi:tetratricopeptide (TPR) repeat protein
VIRPNLPAAAGLLIVLSVLGSGCQWLSQSLTQDDRQAEKRRQRTEAIARSIDQQREQADLLAARDLWQRGDHASCKRRLNELLTRNPEQLEARLLLAEVLLDENQAQEGIRVLKPAEAAHHDDARVQYTMGLLLDASGSQESARSHYHAAALLEPGNDVYTVSYNEAITSAKGIAPPDSGENKDLKQCDPSVPPPPDDAAASRLHVPRTESGRVGPEMRGGPGTGMPGSGAAAGSSGSADSAAGQANRGATGAPPDSRSPADSTPQEFQLPVILRGAAPLPAVSADRPGPQIVRQDFSTSPSAAGEDWPGPQVIRQDLAAPLFIREDLAASPHAAPLPAMVAASPPAPTTPPSPLPVSAPEPDNLSEPMTSPTTAPLAAAKSSTSYSDSRPELPMPMLMALPPAGARIGEETSVRSGVGRIGNPSSTGADPMDGLSIRPAGKSIRISSPTPSAPAGLSASADVTRTDKSAVALSERVNDQAATAGADPPVSAGAAREVSILAVSSAPTGPTAPVAAPQPSRLPRETAAAKKLEPEDASPSLRFVDPAENTGAVEISDGSSQAAGVNHTAHSEPADQAKSTGETVGLPNNADAQTRKRADAGTTAGAAAGLPGNPASTAVQPSGGLSSPRPRDPAPPRLAGTTGQAIAGAASLDSAKSAATEDLLRQGAEALSSDKTDVAMAFFREAAASRPHDPQIPISAAVAALRQNHPEVAVDLLEAATVLFPKSAAVYRALGTACYRRTDYRAAQSALKQALLLDKANPLSYFLLGCTLVKLGEQPAADECFRQAGRLDPKYAVHRQPGQTP